MIRVIYRWRVDPDVATEFESWWHQGTIDIRTGFPGAMGSLLLRSHNDPDIYVGVARWESERRLLAFREHVAPLVFEGAELEGFELFDELDDLTARADGPALGTGPRREPK